MGRELLVREVKAAALLRMEDAARTEKDFKAVVKQWDHNDENEERRQRYHEAQRDEWLLDLGYTYEDYDTNDEITRSLYRQGMAAFGGIAPTYHIALLDKPTIIWDFHSLLLGIQMMFSFALTDDKKPLRCCRHCQSAFIAGSPNALFCSPRCKNQFNVYKGRGKEMDSE